MRVLKYYLPYKGSPDMPDLDGPNDLELPMAARVRAVGIQEGHLRMWVEVDEGTTETQERRFWVVGTGWEFNTVGTRLDYIGTVLEDGGRFVWHVYEERTVAA